MQFRQFILVAFAFVIPSIASAEIWLCDVQERRANLGWIPPTLVFALEPDSNEVAIGMGFGDGVYQTSGQITRRAGNRTIMSFRLEGAQDRTNNYANLAYTISFDRARENMSITMRPLGYDNLFRSRGDCALQE